MTNNNDNELNAGVCEETVSCETSLCIAIQWRKSISATLRATRTPADMRAKVRYAVRFRNQKAHVSRIFHKPGLEIRAAIRSAPVNSELRDSK